jgi:hypothetical protein
MNKLVTVSSYQAKEQGLTSTVTVSKYGSRTIVEVDAHMRTLSKKERRQHAKNP